MPYPDITVIVENIVKQSEILDINGSMYVYKKYSKEPGLIKWFLIKTANLIVQAYPFTINPRRRMIREVTFMDDHEKQVRTPKIILKDWITNSIVREYIVGKVFDPLMNEKEYENIGKVLAETHNSEYVLGDTKYTNFMKSDNEYYIIDAEQAVKTTNKAYMYWDIFVFTTTIIYGILFKKPIIDPSFIKERITSLINSYIDKINYEYQEILSYINKINYKSLIYMLLPYPYNTIYIKTLKQLLKK
jgi:tRNA A-37 threonylcarbamoyl transferase component Bud32